MSYQEEIKTILDKYLAEEVDKVIDQYLDEVDNMRFGKERTSPISEKEWSLRMGMLRELRYRLLGRYDGPLDI